ncbi:hypothetical protein [Actinoplanes philippinensis]|uniref:hypothetical protein n=1 Tax=Actinoplanes philippinensis TaxID=35752 RepID=UPI00340455C1
MSVGDLDTASLGLRWAPATVAAAVEEIMGRQGQSGSGWSDFAEVTLSDAFTSADAAEVFKGLKWPQQLDLVRSLPSGVSMSPRRWPVDLGLGQIPPRRLDEGATRRLLAQVLSWFEDRQYFAREFGYSCVDEDDDDFRALFGVIAERLDLPEGGAGQLLATLPVGRLSDVIAIAREYIAVPPGRYFHPWNGCGWHPLTGRWSAELGRRILDDVIATIAAHSDLGGLLSASRQLGSSVAAPPVVDPLRRTSSAAYAPAEAFLPHGSLLTVTRMITRLAALRQLDAVEALLRVQRMHVESTGQTTSPSFVLVMEVLPEDQARLQRHEAVIVGELGQVSGCGGWLVRYVRPPECFLGAEVVNLDPAVISSRLARAGRAGEAVAALGTSFRFRPRPGLEGGVQLVAVVDDVTAEGSLVLEDAVWRVHSGLRTARVASGLEKQFVEALRPAGSQMATQRRPRVVVVTSRGHVGSDIAPKLDGDVLDVDSRTFSANAPDAATRLASLLRTFATDPSLDAVLIARGGGDASDLNRLVTSEVQTAISSVRQAGKKVVLAIGHGTFVSSLEVDFEALTPGDAGHALRAILVDYPASRRLAIAQMRERLAAAEPDDDWPDLVEREQSSLEQRLAAIGMDHEAVLTRLRQQPLGRR